MIFLARGKFAKKKERKDFPRSSRVYFVFREKKNTLKISITRLKRAGSLEKISLKIFARRSFFVEEEEISNDVCCVSNLQEVLIINWRVKNYIVAQ